MVLCIHGTVDHDYTVRVVCGSRNLLRGEARLKDVLGHAAVEAGDRPDKAEKGGEVMNITIGRKQQQHTDECLKVFEECRAGCL